MPYTCEKCAFTTHIKTHYNRHLETEKHKLKCSPLAQQLHELKIKEMELKTETKMKEYETKADIKREELEKKQELKIKEMELKQQIKDELLKTEEKVMPRHTIERSCSVLSLMGKVIDRPTIEDFNNIFNGADTFQEVFLRDFRLEYAENKSIVLDKNGKTGLYINNHPCMWGFSVTDTWFPCLPRFLSLIPLYHKYLKEFAKENGCKTEYFVLTKEVIAELEAVLIDEITYSISHE